MSFGQEKFFFANAEPGLCSKFEAKFSNNKASCFPFPACAVQLNSTTLLPEIAVGGCYILFPRDNVKVNILNSYMSIDGPLLTFEKEKLSLQILFHDANSAVACKTIFERWVVQTDFNSQYTVLSNAGKGNFSTVIVAAKHDGSPGEKFAVKMIPKKLIEEQKLRKYVRMEVDALRLICHPNVLGLSAVFEDASHVQIVTENLEGGCLEQRVSFGPVNEAFLIRTAIGVLSALEEIHAQGLIHRDLKPANVMYSAEGLPKLIDFGLVVDRADFSPCSGFNDKSGTVGYIAPEIVLHQPGKTRYDNRADIFSLGITLYEAVTGLNPFKCENYEETLRRNVYARCNYSLLRCHPEIACCVQGFSAADSARRMAVAEGKVRLGRVVQEVQPKASLNPISRSLFPRQVLVLQTMRQIYVPAPVLLEGPPLLASICAVELNQHHAPQYPLEVSKSIRAQALTSGGFTPSYARRPSEPQSRSLIIFDKENFGKY